MPIETDVSTATVGSDMPIATQGDSKEQKPKKPAQQKGPDLSMIMPMLQQQSQQIKFEIKKEMMNAYTSQANSLMDVDPATATALNAMANALSSSLSSNMPLGQNPEFNAQASVPDTGITQPEDLEQSKPTLGATPNKPQAGPNKPQPGATKKPTDSTQQKQAADLDEHLFNTTIDYLTSKGYFEKNASNDQEKVAENISETVDLITIGLDELANEAQLDFSDPSTWDVVSEMIYDGTLYHKGKNTVLENYSEDEE